MLEIKEQGSEKEVIEEVRKRKMEGTVAIISFHEDAIANAKKIEPKIETGLIYASYKGKYRGEAEC